MDNLFKNVKILNGYFKGCEGKITDKNSNYYTVIIDKWIRYEEPSRSAVLFEIEDLNITYKIK